MQVGGRAERASDLQELDVQVGGRGEVLHALDVDHLLLLLAAIHHRLDVLAAHAQLCSTTVKDKHRRLSDTHQLCITTCLDVLYVLTVQYSQHGTYMY